MAETGRTAADEENLMKEWAAMAGGNPQAAAAASPDAQPGQGGGDQDAMAKEWEAMLTGGGADDSSAAEVNTSSIGQSTRILNQEEIDSLLGFTEVADSDDHKEGVRAILSSSTVAYERLPMLEIVFDRLVRGMTTSLRNFTQDNVEVSLDSIESYKFYDYLNSIPLPAVLSIFKVEEWSNFGLMTIDSALVYSIVDVLLGGRRGTGAMRIEGRPYTTIERNLVERMIHVILAELSIAFDPLCQVTFRFERLELNPRFASISRPTNAAIVAKLRVDMEDRGGRVDLLIPYATLEPVRELLLQMYIGEKFGRDSIWESHLTEELWLTQVDLAAVLDQQELPLTEVLAWKEGSRLMLNATPDSDVSINCGDIPLFSGKMGRKGHNIAIQINDKIKRTGEI
ncbi:MAG: flagellar motor switch protein FliM [Alphaproteobacteria bacterium]|nr:flagellar motor switch protein FliM [Alphaproteobacteria bacterium]